MNSDENKQLIRRWLEMADTGFSGNFGEFFTPDYAGHLTGRIHMDLADLPAVEDEVVAAESWGELDFAGLWRQLTQPSAAAVV
jgi:hypothetical protein